jgi:hypothetical protein
MRFAIKPFSPCTARASILLFALIFTTLLSSPLKAVDCTSDYIELNFQAQIDNFQSDYGGGGTCDTVPGTLRIGSPDVVDLTPLSALITVRDQVQIRATTNLTDLDGLAALTSVGGDKTGAGGTFYIFDNAALTNFNALSGLVSVGGTLSIGDNPVLASLDGLEALKSVGAISIGGNPSLTSLSGISALVTGNVPWSLGLSGSSLTHLDDLSGLTGVGGSLIIGDNDALANLDGLSALTTVGWNLSISGNDALSNLDGLSSLTSVGGYFRVKGNTALTNLDGLSALREAVSVEVSNNDTLDDCQGIVMLVDPIDDFEPGPGPGSAGAPDVTGYVAFLGNLDGCNSLPDLLGQVPLFEINAGVNDAWFNRETNGQGFFFIVFPEIEQMFMAWFTYDTERPPQDVQAILGEPGHRWLTAQGGYEENVAVLDVFVTAGGVFDSAQPVPITEQDGEIMVEFNTCDSGMVTYDILSIDRQGIVPIERIALDNISLCYLLDNQPVPVETSESD